MALIRTGDMEALAALTAAHPEAVRHLLGRLWDADADVRNRAAEAIGEAAVQHPALGLELLRRFDWALNDESGTNWEAVLPAMAAIAVRDPGMARPFAGRFVAALDDPGLRAAAAAAVARIGREAPGLLAPYRDAGEGERRASVKDRGRSEERGGRCNGA